ncbi:hypothetical protein LJB98_05790 [Bacteroidales bacterium OttesenSCG-928-M11]|nr:hypothetical protein [Bacteroidales bacterium OttesenSCG-928-M11]
MKTTIKIVWSIVILIIGLFLSIMIQIAYSQAGRASGIPALPLLGAIVGIVFVWKKRNDSDKQ